MSLTVCKDRGKANGDFNAERRRDLCVADGAGAELENQGVLINCSQSISHVPSLQGSTLLTLQSR